MEDNLPKPRTITINGNFKHLEVLSKGLTPYSPEVVSRLVEHDKDCAPIDEITQSDLKDPQKASNRLRTKMKIEKRLRDWSLKGR